MMVQSEVKRALAGLRINHSGHWILEYKYVTQRWVCTLLHLISLESGLTPVQIVNLQLVPTKHPLALLRILATYDKIYPS